MTDPEIHSEPDLAIPQGGALRMPRSRGAVSGVLLVLAGAWGALAPFVGPYFHFAYTPKPTETWHWTAARGWYEVLPGGVALFGGLLLILSANRILTSFGAWIAALAGGWFVVGQQVSFLLTLGSPGAPAATGDRRYVAEYLAFFTGLGAVIVLFAAIAIGRLSVRSVRDLRAAARRDQDVASAEQAAAEHEAGASEELERADADRAVTDRNAQSWAAGDQRDGYGTPGASDPGPQSSGHSASAVTTELPAAGAGAAAGALYAGERSAGHDDGADGGEDVDHGDGADRGEDVDHGDGADVDQGVVSDHGDGSGHDDSALRPTGSDQHAPYRRADTGGGVVRPDDDTAAMPVVTEPGAPESRDAPSPAPDSPVEAPRAPEPPDGRAEPIHPENSETIPESTAPAAAPEPKSEPEPEPEPEPETGTEPAAASWSPDAQSPTTTGELPALGTASPPSTPQAPRRGIHQPRRYYGPHDPARPAEPNEAEAVAPRDAVRTDEAGDLEDLDLDERSR